MHKMTDHTSIEDALRHLINWEDMDGWVIIGIDENNNFMAAQQRSLDFKTGSTLLDVLYQMKTNCYCDENNT